MLLEYFRAICVYGYLLFIFTTMYCVSKFLSLLILFNLIKKDEKSILYLKILSFVNYWCINSLFWIKINCEGEIKPITGNIFIFNHVTFIDTFFIMYFLYKKYNYYYRMRVLYDGIFDQFTLFKEFSSATNSIPVYTKLTTRDEDNVYEKEHINELYSKTKLELEKNNNLIIYFEGKLNNHPKTLNKIQHGPFKISSDNLKGIFIIGTKNFDKIWHVNSHPMGTGTIMIKSFNSEPYFFKSKEEYFETISNTIGKWIAE
jgi:1-acyl-sn-glycerol-3-phosphate acyltransferase